MRQPNTGGWYMRSREQIIWDFVQDWLETAERDLRVANLLLGEPGEYGEIIGFHCQQSAEKFIKAWLVRNQIEFPKTHDIAFLRTLVAKRDGLLADRLAHADWLTAFGVEFRYPGPFPEVDRQAAERALADAKQVQAAVLASLQEYLSGGRPEA